MAKSIGQDLQPFTGNGNVLRRIGNFFNHATAAKKNAREGQLKPKQTQQTKIIT